MKGFLTDEDIKNALNVIEKDYKGNKITLRKALVQALSIGMKASEDKIKYGINIVFENLHKS